MKLYARIEEASPLVSVIVPTYNSERTIELCLASIRNQTYRKIEVLVIDGGSTDNTVTIACKLGAKVLKSDRRGRTCQRNMGAFHARGELLLFVDSDEVLPSTLVEECTSKIYNEKFEALFIPTVDWGQTYIGKSKCLGNIIALTVKKGETRIPNSELRFCFKYVFEEIGGYDEDLLVGEDVIFGLKCIKHKFKIGRCKSYIAHYGTECLRNIFLKKYAYGKTFRVYQQKAREFGLSPYREYAEVGLLYLRHFLKFKGYSKYLLGFFVVKLVEMLGLMMGNIFAFY